MSDLTQIVSRLEVATGQAEQATAAYKGAIMNVGYKIHRAYESAVTVTQANDAVQFREGGIFYRWDGAIPTGGLLIPQGTPEPSPSETGSGKYVAVLDLELRALQGSQIRELLRRTYAEAGWCMVAGSFEAGGTLNSPSDVLLHEATGRAYSWPGPFPKVVTPLTSTVAFTDKSGAIWAFSGVMSDIAAQSPRIGAVVETSGFYAPADGGGGVYVVSAKSDTSVDIGAYSFELLDKFDIRKFGIINDVTLSKDQSAQFKKMIAYANAHQVRDIDFHGFSFNNPQVYYKTTTRGSKLRGVWFTHAVSIRNVGMFKNPSFVADLEAGLCCFGVDLTRFDVNAPLLCEAISCNFDAYVDYTNYTQIGEADGFCCGIVVLQNDNRTGGTSFWSGLRTRFKDIHFKTPANSYNIMAPNGFSTHQENLTGQFLGCYVFADSQYNSGVNLRGTVRSDLVRGRLLVQNLVHFEAEAANFVPEYSSIIYSNAEASGLTSAGTFPCAVKVSPVGAVILKKVELDDCNTVELYGANKSGSKVETVRVSRAIRQAWMHGFETVSDVTIEKSVIGIGSFAFGTYEKVTLLNSVVNPFAVGTGAPTVIKDLKCVGCSLPSKEYGIAQGTGLQITKITFSECTHSGVLVAVKFSALSVYGCRITENAAYGVDLQYCAAVTVDVLGLSFKEMPYSTLFINQPSDPSNSKFHIAGVSSVGNSGIGIPVGATVYGGLHETSTAVLSTKAGYNIGSAERKFNELFLTNGTINTSDERYKRFQTITAIEHEAAAEIAKSIQGFKWADAIALKGESSARVHFGVGAQTVVSILRGKGLDPMSYAFVCADEVRDPESGNVDVVFGIRYTELSMFIIAAIFAK